MITIELFADLLNGRPVDLERPARRKLSLVLCCLRELVRRYYSLADGAYQSAPAVQYAGDLPIAVSGQDPVDSQLEIAMQSVQTSFL